MATIGIFSKNQDGYQGTIRTAALQIRARFVPVPPTDKGPAYRIIVGSGRDGAEIGAAWIRTSRDTGMPYLSCRLDDPSWAGPAYASLIENADNNEHALVWSRPRAD